MDRRPGSVAVLVLDLDRFKLVNDSLGHAAGDELLAETARRLESAVRGTDTVARLGGDEFAVLTEDIDGVDEAVVISSRLREAVAAPVDLAGGERVVVTASVGIALASSPGQPPDALLWDADAAMYRAKASGRDRWQLYEDGLRAPALDRFRAEGLLRRAIDHGGLRLHYQPIIDLGRGTMTGVEGLVRVQDPDRGLVPPGEFVGVAEETGLIVPLGSWVIAEACRQAARWGAPATGLTVSLNLSARQLEHPGFLGDVAAGIDARGAPPESLCFEITENALLDAAGATLRSLEALRERGVRLAIDDFGTGHSSLTWLRRLPADIVKIDRSFIAGLGTEPGDTAIVRAVIDLGQALGLTTVAEGVETPEQLDALRELGCDGAQGFWLARPGGPEAISALLADGRRW